jgi:PAS domain S-box-containing protein
MPIGDEITNEHVLAAVAAMIEGTPDAVYIKDTNGHYLLVNPAAARVIGKSREEIVGMADSDLFAADFAADIRAADRRILATELSEVFLYTFTVDGAVRRYEATKGVYRDRRGNVLGVFGIGRDITERERVEAALRESEDRFKNFMDNSPAIAFMKDEEGKYVYVNRVFEERFGLRLQDLFGRTDFDLWPQEIARAFRSADRAVLEADTGDQLIEVAPDPDGSIHHWQVFKFPFKGGGGKRYVGGMAIDITEARETKHKLEEYAERLQALSRRLLEVQEQERRYLARELHDEIGQLLTGLQLSLQASGRLDGPEAGQYLRESQKLVRELALHVRDLSLRLRPTMLDDLGLLPALLWLFDSYTARTQIQVAFQHSGLDERLGPDVETAAYRIVQEALTNVARHAQVSEVGVRAFRDNGSLHLQIEDHGPGFDVAVHQNSGRSAGLSGMHERAALLGGRLGVESGPGIGTRVSAVLPIGETAGRKTRDSEDRVGGRSPDRAPGLAGDFPLGA